MHRITLFLLLIAVLVLCSPTAVSTAQPMPPQIQIAQEATGVRLTFAGAGVTRWPTVEIRGMLIPAQLVVVGLAHTAPASPITSALDYHPWAGQLTPRPRPMPQANGQERPDLAALSTSIPTTPITLLREGQSRGQRIAVLAVASIIERDGRLCQLTRLDATLPGAQLLDESLHASAMWRPSTSGAAVNPAANRPSATIHVRAGGMQRISGATLARLLPGSISLDPTRLHLYHQGREVAVQRIGIEDGRLDAAEVAAWWNELEQAEQAGNFFFGLLGFVVAGRKPSAAL